MSGSGHAITDVGVRSCRQRRRGQVMNQERRGQLMNRAAIMPALAGLAVLVALGVTSTLDTGRSVARGTVAAQRNGDKTLLVAAAASLGDVMQQIATAFGAETGIEVRLNFAASNT